MVAVAERVAEADGRVRRWRTRRLLLAVLGAAVIVVAVWAVFRTPAAVGPPLVHGGVSGGPHCDAGVRTQAVADTFGGGGTILDFVDGARCEAVISLVNTLDVPVRVLAVEKTRPDFIEPLRLVTATRDTNPASAEQECMGCPEDYVSFTPMTIAPDDEWEIAVQGVMRGCRPAMRARDASTMIVRDTVDFTIEVLGVRRDVTVKLQKPWAVRSNGCRG